MINLRSLPVIQQYLPRRLFHDSHPLHAMSQDTDRLLEPFDLVEASISDIRTALATGRTTAVELAAECLRRIARYDCKGLSLNAIPILHHQIFEQASASDERRAAGKLKGPLDGIPYTVKDSYQVKGMTLANGSPALQHLVSTEDAFAVQRLKEAGAVLIGRTNMPPMAAGGMQRGVYGRAENPYNPEYLAAAFASGSSNGSAVATAASFATLGLGSETVSSGRSPASNNALVAYTPSKGYISIRGVWPLYPTCDVLVPQTRTVDDMLELLDIISAEDVITTGDFWRDQQFVQLPASAKPSSFTSLPSASLAGMRIAVPSCYVGGPQLAHALPVYTSPEVIAIWERAKVDLEARGAEVILIEEFPIVQMYENPDCAAALGRFDSPRLPDGWNSVERGALIVRTWDNFLRRNNDPSLSSFDDVDADRLFPAVASDHPQIAYAEPANAIHYSKLKDYLAEAVASNPANTDLVYATPNLAEACRTLELLRKELFDDWLVQNRYDTVAFPAAGDVGKADADIAHESGKHAWTNGVKYSNGNRAIRHLGIPTVTVPMGVIEGKGIPVGLTFCGPAYSDPKLLGVGKAFEAIKQRRLPPRLTPTIMNESPSYLLTDAPAPYVTIESVEKKSTSNSQIDVSIQGNVSVASDAAGDFRPYLDIYVDSNHVPRSSIGLIEQTKHSPNAEGRRVYSYSCQVKMIAPESRIGYEVTEAKVAGDYNMVVVLARSINEKENRSSRPAGCYRLI